MKESIVEQVRRRPKYLHNVLNFQSDFPNLIEFRAIFPKVKGPWPQVLKGRKIPVRDWNDLPESLISSSELSDDSVSKFTSLVRARD